MNNILRRIKNAFHTKSKKKAVTFSDPYKGITLETTGRMRTLDTIDHDELALRGTLSAPAPIEYILVSSPDAFTSVIPANKFQVWMSELERVMTYYLFFSTDERPVRSPVRLNFSSSFNGIAYTHDYRGGKEIIVSTAYMQKIASNRATAYFEISGIVLHELTHCFQNNAQGGASGALIEGIADFVRLKGGVASATWQRNLNSGPLAGYSATAYFLEYADTQYPNYVRSLNRLMANGWNNDFYAQVGGGTNINDLWTRYVQAYRR